MESKYQVWFIPAILGVYCRKPAQYARVSASVSNIFKDVKRILYVLLSSKFLIIDILFIIILFTNTILYTVLIYYVDN